ncbi:hypothetical protein GF373_05070 [bacterium]|nr:hypothetical protein [bacterium]
MNEQQNPAFKTYLTNRKEEIEKTLFSLVPTPEGFASRLNEAMRYPLEAGGKRIRPILLLLGAEFCRGVTNEAIYAGRYWEQVNAEQRTAILQSACALEMIHTYSLVHDDLPCMDDDDLRRGKPTTHKVYGEAMAVLAADALHTLGFQILANIPETYSLQSMRAARELALACGYPGMVAGQVVDLEYENKTGNLDVLEYIHHHKTAALIRASLLMGAHLVSGNEADKTLLNRVGNLLGLLFQVVDDILDVIGDTDTLGKKVGSDESHHKLTYPSLIGLESSQKYADELFEEIWRLLKPEENRAGILIDMAREFVRRKA